LLILAVYRERPFEGKLLAITLVLLATSALMSIHGMTALALYERRPRRTIDPDPDAFDRYIDRLTISASTLLTAAVIVFALFLFDVPFLIALGGLGAALLFVVLVLLRRHRKATCTLESERATESRPWWRRIFG